MNENLAQDPTSKNPEVILSLRQVEKIYQESIKPVTVLRGLDFDIYQHDFLAIQGASGVGKSTLLNILGLLDLPSQGEVIYKKQNLRGVSDSRLSQIRNHEIGFVFQFHHLLPDFTAWENVLFPLRIRGKIEKSQLDYAHEILDWVQMNPRKDHFPSELSGGERQRIALARALIHTPALLIADEPSGNLDDENSQKLHQLLQTVHAEKGVTVVLATHDESLASLAHKRYWLQDGTLSPYKKES